MEREYGSCPDSGAFLRWYRRKVNGNLEHLMEAGKSVRDGFCVTEEQANKKFKLLKDPEPGAVAQKLSECGLSVQTKDAPEGLQSETPCLCIFLTMRQQSELKRE